MITYGGCGWDTPPKNRNHAVAFGAGTTSPPAPSKATDGVNTPYASQPSDEVARAVPPSSHSESSAVLLLKKCCTTPL